MKPFHHIVIHYDEIGLKSQNRGQFEKLLMRNIHTKLGDAYDQCHRESGQLTLTLTEGADPDTVCDALARVPGIAYFSPARRVPSSVEAFSKEALAWLSEREFTTFGVRAHRRDKSVPFRSMEVNCAVGQAILEGLEGKRVDLDRPDIVLKVEITKQESYLSVDRFEGVGGLPTNARQNVICLLSGGLDSPVAAYLMMKRGCAVTLVHFQNSNQMTASVEDKIQQLAAQLSRYQIKTKLFLVPFDELQRTIIKHVKASQRMLIYRRVMLRMAAKLAEPIRAKFLVTGDCLSQVASQTYDNLAATYSDAPLPVLSPLIGMDKREIVDVARRIGTYEISSLPYEDCCTFFVPKHPELRGCAEDLHAQEEAMELDDLVTAAIAETRVEAV